jgi:osmotically-inducible protein OsmY
MKTDAQLLADLHAELDWDPSFDHRDIIVEVKDGLVALAGHVNSYRDKLQVENAAKTVAGVRGIANEIDVVLGAPSKRSDQEIAAATLSMLRSSVSVPANTVTVTVADGWITLNGKVSLWFQKDAAETAVSSLWGVKGVSNDIEVTAVADASSVKEKIQQSFKRLAKLDTDKITVEVRGGTVTLTGVVQSLSERDTATRTAWSAPGVTSVQNFLTVG